jgi:hypothetical protein
VCNVDVPSGIGSIAIGAQNEGTGRRVVDNTHGTRINPDSLEQIEMNTEGISKNCLDDIAVGNGHIDRIGTQHIIPVTDGTNGPIRHMRH